MIFGKVDLNSKKEETLDNDKVYIFEVSKMNPKGFMKSLDTFHQIANRKIKELYFRSFPVVRNNKKATVVYVGAKFDFDGDCYKVDYPITPQLGAQLMIDSLGNMHLDVIPIEDTFYHKIVKEARAKVATFLEENKLSSNIGVI